MTVQAQTFGMTHAQGTDRVDSAGQRESVYRIFMGCPNMVMDLQIDAVLGVFQRRLQDQESIKVGLFFWIASCFISY